MSTNRKRYTEVSHVDDPAEVGRRLRSAREQAGLSQRQLSFQGCSPAYLSRIEAGDRTPSLQLLRELARRLGVTEEYLTYGIEAEPAGVDPLFEAELALRMDDGESAEELYRSELEGDDTGRRAAALEGLGQLAFRRSELHEAIDLFEEASALYGDEAVRRSELSDTLGRCYAFVGDVEASIALYRRALAAADEREDVLDSVRFSVLLSCALADGGRLADAEEIVATALTHANELSDPLARVNLYWAQCRLHIEKGRPDLAERYGRKVIDLLERTEDSFVLSRALRLMINIELDRGRAPEALEFVERARTALGDVADVSEESMISLLEARAFAQLGELDRAAAQAMELAGTLSDRPVAGQMYGLLAATFAEQGDAPKAIELYELACELLEQTPNRHLVDAYARLADLLEAEGKKDEAFAVLKKAVSARARAEQPAGHPRNG